LIGGASPVSMWCGSTPQNPRSSGPVANVKLLWRKTAARFCCWDVVRLACSIVSSNSSCKCGGTERSPVGGVTENTEPAGAGSEVTVSFGSTSTEAAESVVSTQRREVHP